MTHYTMSVFGTRYFPVKRLKTQTVIERQGYGIQGWNPVNASIHQVAVKTNASKPVYRFSKHPDGRISGYLDRDSQ